MVRNPSQRAHKHLLILSSWGSQKERLSDVVERTWQEWLLPVTQAIPHALRLLTSQVKLQLQQALWSQVEKQHRRQPGWGKGSWLKISTSCCSFLSFLQKQTFQIRPCNLSHPSPCWRETQGEGNVVPLESFRCVHTVVFTFHVRLQNMSFDVPRPVYNFEVSFYRWIF